MKKSIVIMALAFVFTTPVFAYDNNEGGEHGNHSNHSTGTCTGIDAGSVACSDSTSDASNAGNNQAITIEAATVPTETKVEVKNVPSVGAPALTSSNDTCMGSTSVGAAGVGFGITIGSTWTDNNCTMLKNSREMWNMGMKAASLARMCMDDKNREALEVTGFECPAKKEKAKDTKNWTSK